MIKELLQKRYPNEFGLPYDNVEVICRQLSGKVVLSDGKACAQCHQRLPERAACSEENLKIDFGDKTVISVDFEGYITQFDKTKAQISERCDYLLVDDERYDKIVFCDLTCSEEKYVNDDISQMKLGKRAKVVRQVKKSLEQLLKVSLFDNYVLTFPQKIGLFGWRDYGMTETVVESNIVENSMLTFMKTPSSMAQTLHEDCMVIGHNFEFVQVKYPSEYKW